MTNLYISVIMKLAAVVYVLFKVESDEETKVEFVNKEQDD